VRLKSTRWAWEDTAELDIDAHLVQETLPAPAGDQELQELVGHLMAQPLCLQRPLWRLHLIQGHHDRSAMLWRLHHAMGDGIALTVLLLALTDLETEPGEAKGSHGPWGSANPLASLYGGAPAPMAEIRRFLEDLLPEGSRLMLRPAEALAAAGRWLTRAASVPAFGRLAGRPSDPRTRFKGPLGGAKRVAWSRPIPLEGIHAARRRLGGTVNDILIGAVAGALRRYLEAKGDSTRRLSFRAVIPVSLRPLSQMHELGNRFGLVFLRLPVGVLEPRKRLAELRRRMGALKRSVEPVVVLGVLGLLGRSPKPVQDLVIRIFGTKGTVVLSNVPGPARALHLAGGTIRGLIFWVPQAGHLGMGISVMTYAGEARLGIATDSALVPDPEVIVAGFEEEVAELALQGDGAEVS
jgi:diacylglycerol O-acyltransferase / wax synthase